MNITKITEILEKRKQAAEEAKKIQAVLTGIEKVCTDEGFESYASFLQNLSAFEGAVESGDKSVSVVGSEHADKTTRKTRKAERKTRIVLTQELVDKLKEAFAQKGDNSLSSIAKSFNVSIGTLRNLIDLDFKFDPKKKGRKPGKK